MAVVVRVSQGRVMVPIVRKAAINMRSGNLIKYCSLLGLNVDLTGEFYTHLQR